MNYRYTFKHNQTREIVSFIAGIEEIEKERWVVTVINADDSTFTYGVNTIGGRENAISQVRGLKHGGGVYEIFAERSDKEADYELTPETFALSKMAKSLLRQLK